MFVVKILGVLDLLVAVVMILLNYGLMSKMVAVGALLYLLAKGFAFRADISSIFDIITGVYIIFMIFGFSSIMTLIFVIYLVEKGIISLI